MPSTFMYVGGCNRALPYCAEANGRGVARFRFDEDSGVVTPLGLTGGVDNPTFLAVDPSQTTLYATSEVVEWEEGVVSAYAIDPASGALSYINKQPTRGGVAAYVGMDRSGRFVLVANYGAAPMTHRPNRSFVVLARSADGELSGAVAEATHAGQGPIAGRQERPHAHCALATPDNRFLVVADLGIDKLILYRFDAQTGATAPHGALALPPGSGPRHFVFHPTRPLAYVACELSSSVVSLAFDAERGHFDTLGAAPTVPAAAMSGNACSEIRMSACGRHLYVGNRGHDSIARFAIDPENGVARWRDATPSGGKTPRHFALDPSGRFLAVANQDSDRIAVFAVGRDDGALTPTGQDIFAGTPTAVAFARIG